MTLRDHESLVGSFIFGYGVLIALTWVLTGGLFAGQWLVLISVIFFLLAGWKVKIDDPNARTFGIIASVLCILSFPIGTAVGVYGLWTFLIRSKNLN